MAWSPQSSGTAWPGQPVTAAFEPERASTSTNLLAQLGLVPSQAMPAGGAHSGSMQSQTLLSTTVAPQRSQLVQHNAEQMSRGCIETSTQAQLPFPLTPPNQRYQAFSPSHELLSGEPEWAPGSAMKQFRFNPNAVPFVFQTSPCADNFSEDSTNESGAARLSDGEELGAGDAEAVSASVASLVLSSPPAGPAPPPPGAQFLVEADAVASSMHCQAPPLLVLPSCDDPATEGLWRTDPPAAMPPGLADAFAQLWLPVESAKPLQSSQEAVNGYSTPTASPTSHAEAMSPMLMQLRGTAHSVALGCLDMDLGPSFSPRDSSLWSDFSLSATAV